MQDETCRRRLMEIAVRRGVKAYVESRRAMVDTFITQHYSLRGTCRIHRQAFGWDLLRSPFNMLWSPVAFSCAITGKALKAAHLRRPSALLARVPKGFRTDVEGEVEWLVYSELLQLPYTDRTRSCTRNALVESILSQGEFLGLLQETLGPAAERVHDPAFRSRLENKLATYLDNRKDVGELAATLFGLAAGAAVYKKMNLGALGAGQATAAAIAHHAAVSSFFLGETMGGVFYSVFPGMAVASTGLVVGATGGVAALFGVAGSFAGIVTDPLQKSIGLHRRKLTRLMDRLENQLVGEGKQSYELRDGLVNRLLDAIDLLASVVN